MKSDKSEMTKKPMFKNPAAVCIIFLGIFISLATNFLGNFIDIGAIGYFFGVAVIFICCFFAIILTLRNKTE